MDDKERKKRLAYAIRRAREQRELTPPQLAEKLGKSRGTVNDWESGKSAPSLLDLGPLSRALGVDPRLFAVLPPEPPSEVDDFLVSSTVLGALEVGLAADVHPEAVPAAKPEPRRSPRRRVAGAGR